VSGKELHEFLLGIDFGGTKIALGTATRDGRLLESARIDTEAPNGAAQAVERTLAAARELLGRTPGECVAVGAVSPGVVRPDGISLAPNVPGWEDVPLARTIADGLGIERIAVGNDVKSAALAESRWGALRGADPAMLLSVGTGVAAGIVVGGRVLDGANGAAGEIGYSLVDPQADAGAANGRAPLEEVAGGRAIGERASRATGSTLTAAQAFASADVRARSIVTGALAQLAVGVANAAIVLDPARIAVAGGLMTSAAVVLSSLEERLRLAVPFPPELVPARFVQDGPLRGAVALAAEAVA
jgi:glucokinase